MTEAKIRRVVSSETASLQYQLVQDSITSPLCSFLSQITILGRFLHKEPESAIMDYNDLIKYRPFVAASLGIYTNFLEPPEEYVGVHMISFSLLMEEDITEELIDGDFEEEEDLGTLSLGIINGEIKAEYPSILDDSQINALINLCDVDFQFSNLLGVVVPVFTFRNSIIERVLLDTPVQQRSFYLHSGMMPWYRMMESYMQGGPLELQDREEMEWELGVLRRDMQVTQFAFAFNFLFYGTLIMGWLINGTVRPGLRGGARKPKKETKKERPVPEPSKEGLLPRRKPNKTNNNKKKKELPNPVPRSEQQQKPVYVKAPDFVSMVMNNPTATTDDLNKIFEDMVSEFGNQLKDPKRKSIVCFNCNEVGHGTKECTKPIICRVCGRPGHKAAACKEPKTGKGGSSRGKKKSNLVASALVSSLQEEQGKSDALKEILRDAIEQKRSALEKDEKKEEKTEEIHRVTELVKSKDAVDLTVKPDRTGITFRTGTKIYFDREVKYENSMAVNGIIWLKNLSIRASAHVTNKLPRFLSSPINYLGRSLCSMLTPNDFTKSCLSLFGLYKTKVYNPPPRRLGGLIHSISLQSKVADEEDCRLDYLAVGDLKHNNPEYCTYTVQRCEVVTPSILSLLFFSIPKFFVSLFVPLPSRYEEVTTEEKMCDTYVSKEAFKNMVSFRISPFNSEESAKNSVKLGLTKLAAINHSRHFVEENTVLDGTSDEVLTRTYESIVAFREHLVEEQVAREAHKMIMKAGSRLPCGVFTPDDDFIRNCLN